MSDTDTHVAIVRLQLEHLSPMRAATGLAAFDVLVAERDRLREALQRAEANRDQWHSAANERQEAIDALLDAWDKSADSLGPEWTALGELIDALRVAVRETPQP